MLKEFDVIIENGNILIPPLLQQSSMTPLQVLENNGVLTKSTSDGVEREEIEKLKKENIALQKRYDELLEKIMGKNPDLSFIAAHVLSQNPSLILRGPTDSTTTTTTSTNNNNNNNINPSSSSNNNPLINPLTSNPPSSSSQPRSLHQSPQDTVRTIEQLDSRSPLSYSSTSDITSSSLHYSPSIDHRGLSYVPQQYSPPTQLSSYTSPGDSRRIYDTTNANSQSTVYSSPSQDGSIGSGGGGGSGGNSGGNIGVDINMSAPSSYRTLPIHSYNNTNNTITIPSYMNNIQANSIPSVLRPTNYAIPYNPTVGSSRNKNQPISMTPQQQEYNVQLTTDQSSIYEQLIAQFPSFSPDYILHLFV